MKLFWWCASAAVVAMTNACATEIRPKPISGPFPKVTHLRVKPGRGPIQRVPLEDYVRATILSEFDPPAGDSVFVERMLEVQAVIARTYAIAHLSRHDADGFDLCSTTHCQLYQPARLRTSMWKRNVEEAARHTAGRVLWYRNAPARALFHADCGGHTSAAHDVWQGPERSYLAASRDDGPAEIAHVAWRFEIEDTTLANALNSDPRMRVGRQVTDIRVANRDSGGRATQITIRGTRQVQVRGNELRSVMTRRFGARSVRSTKFDVERHGRKIVFVGRGYGHGVGLCQAGAYARLTSGARPEQVLGRYYPGTRLVLLP